TEPTEITELLILKNSKELASNFSDFAK
ncbi:hypothetical protein LCGC14_2626270, partial [marine sediment metagenome]